MRKTQSKFDNNTRKQTLRYPGPKPVVAMVVLILYFTIDIHQQPPPQEQPQQQPTQHRQVPHQKVPPMSPDLPPTIAYMSQGPEASFLTLWDRFKDSEQVKFYYHTFDKPCTMPKDGYSKNKPVCLFKQKTSFAQGRQLLLRRAIQDQEQLNTVYYTFFDDDVRLFCGKELQQWARNFAKLRQIFTKEAEKQCWKEYTEILLNSSTEDSWPLQRPGDFARDWVDVPVTNWHSCVDANFQAHHRDYLWLITPASYALQDKSWHIKGRARHVITQLCFPNLWRVNNNFQVGNAKNRQYPRINNNSPMANVYLNEYLNYTFSPMGPWQVDEFVKTYGAIVPRCNVSSIPPPSKEVQNPLCQKTLRHRFNSWLNGTFEPELWRDENAEEY